MDTFVIIVVHCISQSHMYIQVYPACIFSDLSDASSGCGRPVEQGGDGEGVNYGNGVQESATSSGVGVSSILNHMCALQGTCVCVE